MGAIRRWHESREEASAKPDWKRSGKSFPSIRQSPRRQAMYAQTLAAIGGLAASDGSREEEARSYREAMGIFKTLVERGTASLEDLSNYAEQLLTHQPSSPTRHRRSPWPSGP